jgi:membrane fusion protein (multidrug efflux system)
MAQGSFAKKGMRFVLPIILIVGMILWLTGAFRRGRVPPGEIPSEGRPATGVEPYRVVRVQGPILSEAVGTVQPEFQIALSPRVSAQVVEMRVRAGQRVRKDDVLVRLDSRDLAARVAQAKETLHRAQAIRDLAASDFRRDQPLVEKAVIPRSEFDQTEMRLRTAEADLLHAQEALREAEVALSYTEIRSPTTGVVIDRLSDVGDLAIPGKPLLTMYEENHLWLEAQVREQEASLLRIGETYTVKIEATGDTMQSKLVEIVPSADPASRTVTARMALPRTEGLYPGMFGRVSIPLRVTSRLLIPQKALLQVGQLTFVDVIANETLHRRSIQTGERMDDRVEVLSGLAEGELVALPPPEGWNP